ncbi:hypothetical protein [Salinispora oceanensis]|uniref:hypothetical protein n=1 Tax=Salinispora oceanensis TaxID=1050199 RepID=UPI001CC82B9C|nr:hypothetical protein [Salinispora oceanensis]
MTGVSVLVGDVQEDVLEGGRARGEPVQPHSGGFGPVQQPREVALQVAGLVGDAIAV